MNYYGIPSLRPAWLPYSYYYPLHCWTDTFKHFIFPEAIDYGTTYSLISLHLFYLHKPFTHAYTVEFNLN